MTHFMNLYRQPFENIKAGKKTIELRLYDEKRRNICVGDTIRFRLQGSKETIETRVLHLFVFSSFEELYKALPLDKCGYTDEDVGSASPKDMEVYYSPVEQSKHGVVGIEIVLV